MAQLPKPIPTAPTYHLGSDITVLWETLRETQQYLQQLQTDHAQYVTDTAATLTDMQQQIDTLNGIVNP